MKESHTITITEDTRQIIILALARLAIDRPGWLHACNDTALQMDNPLPGGEAEMFHSFLKLRLSSVVERLEGRRPTHRVSQIEWRNAARDLPDNDRTVILCWKLPNNTTRITTSMAWRNACERTRFGEAITPDIAVWIGWYNHTDKCWFDVEANQLDDVIYWAKMPQSPVP